MSHATITDETPLDPDDELLVAYLDGELDAKTENDLMNRLMDDQGLNERLRSLQEGWEWLDKLPGATPSEKLVESTLELVVADLVKTKPSQESIWKKHRLLIAVAMACLLGVVVTASAVSLIKASQYRQQLRDLEIAEHLDAYLHGEDFDLMRRLRADQSWTQMIDAAREIGEITPSSDVSLAKTPVDRRGQLLESLPLEDRDQLASRWERFVRLDQASEARVRLTASAVEKQPDADALLQTMDLYSTWIEKLPPELRDEIESDDAKVQRRAIVEAIEITQASTMKRSRDQLSDEAMERIYFALRQILRERIEAGETATIKLLETVPQWAGDLDPEPFGIMAIVSNRFEDREGSRGRRGPPFPGRGRWERPPSLRDDELDVIRLFLPDDAQDLLDVLTSSVSMQDTMLLRNLTLRSWAEAATRNNLPQRPESTLLERYQELSPAERDRIDLLPPNELLERMSRPPWPMR